MLKEHGLIEVDPGKNLKTGLTLNDIIDDNGYNIEIVENSEIIYNYKNKAYVVAFMNILDACLNEIDISDRLVAEASTSKMANLYGNIIAVKEENKNNPKILALIEVLKSQEIKDFINQKFEGKVAPVLD